MVKNSNHTKSVMRQEMSPLHSKELQFLRYRYGVLCAAGAPLYKCYIRSFERTKSFIFSSRIVCSKELLYLHYRYLSCHNLWKKCTYVLRLKFLTNCQQHASMDLAAYWSINARLTCWRYVNFTPDPSQLNSRLKRYNSVRKSFG